MSVTAVIVAGGRGERFGSAEGKQLAKVAGRPLLSWSVAAFDACELVDAIVLVAHPDRIAEYREAARSGKLHAVVAAGETRQESVANGLAAVPEATDVVAVHDGARPLVTPETVRHALSVLAAHPELAGAVVGHPMIDTVKRVGGRSTQDCGPDIVARTVHRHGLWVAQTPQVFRLDPLREAYAQANARRFLGTDDSQLVERAGGRVKMVRGSRDNIKVTVPEDLVIVEAVLQARKRGLA
jgi:2-C-methyl-D-erythritol 4-phosphate cytidylyltransferase